MPKVYRTKAQYMSLVHAGFECERIFILYLGEEKLYSK